MEETRSTLQFASRAKLVKTHACVNEVMDEGAKIRRLQRELEELRKEYNQLKEGGAAGVQSNSSDPSNTTGIDSEKNELRVRLGEVEKEKAAQEVFSILFYSVRFIPSNCESYLWGFFPQ